MGLFDSDDINLYRNNILEIPWDKLEGVPTNLTGDPPAINQGVVQVRCFIHPYCPFVKVPKEEYDLVFNSLTMPVINEALPDDAKKSLTTTGGLEGVHFTEKYIYRHNYIQREILRQTTPPSTWAVEIENSKNALESVYETRYREEQTWLIRESPFDGEFNTVDSNLFISLSSQIDSASIAQWGYHYPSFTSSYTTTDELLDYKKDYYEDNSQNFNKDNKGINTTNVQMPRQTATTDSLGESVHWRVEKKTPLYRGEDFFIEFHRHAKSANINSKRTGDDKNTIPFNPSFENYRSIDVFGDEYGNNTEYDIAGDETLKVFINRAVRESDDPEERSSFRLFDQAYYIIEMGDITSVNTDGKKEHYFIIITERDYPIFVAIDTIDGADDFEYSRVLSTFKEGGIHGSALINAEKMRITVRNHLGKLAITFDIDGNRSNPWIIERTDYLTINQLAGAISSGGQSIDDKGSIGTPLTVPNSTIHLWGGNLLCGFVFGPLQYSREKIEFVWPQQHSLPDNTKISARLTTSDDFIHDMERYQDIPGTPTDVDPLFTQQAHFYKQWGRSNQFSDLDDVKNGVFFYGRGVDPLIALSPDETSVGVRDSSIFLSIKGSPTSLSGYTWHDVDRHRQKFYLKLNLTTGSHKFSNSEQEGWRGIASGGTVTSDSILSDDEWIVNSCKTPILTSIRLVGEVNDDEPRWADGTTSSGYDGLPNPSAPHFRDVSHHVTSYNENWSSSDFYEIEHTGTINFLLKEVAIDVNGVITSFDDSEYLKSLQDKSFYIEVWAGYEPLGVTGKEYTQMNGFYKLFTGICYGGMVDKTQSREMMTCKIHDYKKILQDQKFFNSPFFDGMRDVNAVLEIMNMAGFRSKGPADPGKYLRDMKEDDFSTPIYYTTSDGRFFIDNKYALPSSYRRIEQAFFKFEAGSTLYDGIIKIAHNASKLFYFDQHGVAHFESYLDLERNRILGGEEGQGAGGLFAFTSNHTLYDGQLIYNKLEKQFRVEDVHNHLKIMSATPNKEILFADDLRWESLDDPTQEGFLGYKKLFYQRAGFLGSEGAVRKLIDFYRVMFRPEVFVKFETHGIPIRATDHIWVDNEFLRVSKVTHNIDAKENKWWMNVEGERMQPVQ
jgi:hypothetical protein